MDSYLSLRFETFRTIDVRRGARVDKLMSTGWDSEFLG